MTFCVGMAEGRSKPVQSGAVPIPGGGQETTGHSTYCCGLVNKVVIRQRLEVFSNQNDSVMGEKGTRDFMVQPSPPSMC